MAAWRKVLVPLAAPIRDAVKAIDRGEMQIALVVDTAGRLSGTITDGDVRRALLRGASLDEPLTGIMNSAPVTVSAGTSAHEILALMRKTMLRCIPMLDNERRITDMAVLNELLHYPQSPERDNLVLIMAGGLGTRLSPLTDERPKPMVQVGAKPILETILDGFRNRGFRNFYLSVNYKADVIKDYFADGSRWGISIRYVEEDHRLGTAGALSLLPERPDKSLLVMNGDLLTNINLQTFLDFHQDRRAVATMCVREYDFQVPYGVVRIDNDRLTGIDEKPVQRFFVNAGIYALEPAALELIPRNAYFDMTTLFEKLIESGQETAAFPIREYWLDVGRLNDLERARAEYGGLFR